jgi:hypothetical protein
MGSRSSSSKAVYGPARSTRSSVRDDFEQPRSADGRRGGHASSSTPLPRRLVRAGCSSSPSADAPEESTERPAGCARTECDVDYDRCKPTETDRCAQCTATCSTIDYEFAFQCPETCSDICSSPSTSVCDSTRDSCVKTHRNAVCTDGMDPNDLPKSPDWFYSFHSPAEPHQGACTADELKQFDEACLGAKSSTSACEAFSKAHAGCRQCIVTDALAPAVGAARRRLERTQLAQ